MIWTVGLTREMALFCYPTTLATDCWATESQHLWTHCRTQDPDDAVRLTVVSLASVWSSGRRSGWVTPDERLTFERGSVASDAVAGATATLWRILILDTVRLADGVVDTVAKVLGIDRKTVYRYCSAREIRQHYKTEVYPSVLVCGLRRNCQERDCPVICRRRDENTVLQHIRSRQYDRQSSGGIGVDQCRA